MKKIISLFIYEYSSFSVAPPIGSSNHLSDEPYTNEDLQRAADLLQLWGQQ